MKKFTLFIQIIICLLLSSCSIENTNTSKGSMEEISISTLKESVEKDYSFAVYLSLSKCMTCSYISTELDNFISENNYRLYKIVIDDDENKNNYESEKSFFDKTFPGKNAFPVILWIDNGEMINECPLSYDSNEQQVFFKKWFRENNVDKNSTKILPAK